MLQLIPKPVIQIKYLEVITLSAVFIEIIGTNKPLKISFLSWSILKKLNIKQIAIASMNTAKIIFNINWIVQIKLLPNFFNFLFTISKTKIYSKKLIILLAIMVHQIKFKKQFLFLILPW